MELKIAILDTGVTEPYNTDLSDAVSFVNEDEGTHCNSHANMIYKIIRSYTKKSKIYSAKILDYQGNGDIEELNNALAWCYENKIKIINISLGSTSFIDCNVIRKLINYYTNRGLFIISAIANSGFTSYIACCSNVIGVTSEFIWRYKKLSVFHHGVDFITAFNDIVRLENGLTIRTDGNNSYVTPYVTTIVYHMLKNMMSPNIYQLKQELLKSIRNKYNEDWLYNPDWIENAYITFDLPCTKAKYYFNKLYDASTSFESIQDKIDTIIIFHLEDLNKLNHSNKKIIVLNENFSQRMEEISNFFWSKLVRSSQIKNTNTDLYIDVPVVLCRICDSIDQHWFLQEIKKMFNKDLYNPYIASTKIESILYDIEYLSKDFFGDSDVLKSFLADESYYKKKDLIILVVNDEMQSNNFQKEIDTSLTVFIEYNNELEIKFIREKVILERIYKCLNLDAIRSIYLNIKKMIA
ncbi:MAG: S8 family serine peptidase [bacterium]|nr:S8 family serine peptidase [bacterium]